jgi:hypothetical protein
MVANTASFLRAISSTYFFGGIGFAQDEARVHAPSTPVLPYLHRRRHPYKMHEYLARGDFLLLGIENPERTLAMFDLLMKSVYFVHDCRLRLDADVNI